MAEETSSSKKGPTFDLSDGFGREDIFAIIVLIWRIFIGIFKIIFYPYVWVVRQLGRAIRFMRVKDAGEKPLSKDERYFIESFPVFFVLVGLLLGILLGVVVAFFRLDAITSFFESLSLDTIIEVIAGALGFIVEIVLIVIGFDTTGSKAGLILPPLSVSKDLAGGKIKTERFGIMDVIRTLFEFVLGIIGSDPILLFMGIGIIGVVLAVVWILVSETGIVRKIVTTIASTLSFLVSAPSRIFNRGNELYRSTNRRVSAVVFGEERLSNRSVAFHRKIILLSLGLGLYTFFGGLFVLASQQFDQTTLQIGFILIVLLVFGLGVGLVEMFLVVRFLDTASRGRYTLSQPSKE